MSLNSALLAGTTGLLANSGALAAISDNIANVNTPAYKRTLTTFVPQIKANSNTITYAAGGVSAQTRQLIDQQGLLSSSSSSTDVGISGSGFFVTTTKPEGLTPGDPRLFTRAGAFSPDENGFLVNDSGYFLQGWPVGTDGTVSANPTDLSALESINIGAIGGTAEATTRVQFNANLNADEPPFTGVYDPNTLANSMVGYDPITGTGVEPDFERSIQVTDSKGGVRTINYAFLRSTTANEWYVEAYAANAADLQPVAGSSLIDRQVARGIVAFNPDGTFNADAPADPALRFPTTLSVGASDPADDLPGAPAPDIRWATDLGLEGQNIQFDFGGPTSTGGLTQLSSPSILLSTTVNGSAFGDLASVEVDSNGFVTALFNNGVAKQVYQLPIATFINPNGLAPQNGGAYQVTAESGAFTLKQPGTGGAGLISPKTLESSNVDLATEFTGLITTQRAYSAASKIITTADEMLEELIRMKR